MNVLESVGWLIENPDKKVKQVSNGIAYYMWFNGQGYLRRSYIDSDGEVSFTGYTSGGNWQPISWEEDERVINYQNKIENIKNEYLKEKKFYDGLIEELKPLGYEKLPKIDAGNRFA